MADVGGAVPHLLPVANLTIPERWSVGNVVFHPAEHACHLLPTDVAIPPAVQRHVDDVMASVGAGCMAVVDAPDYHHARDSVRSALAALRLLQYSRRDFLTPQFGLPGEVLRSINEYVVLGEHIGVGGAFVGDPEGFAFVAADLKEWMSAKAFRFLDAALRDPDATESTRRAVLGTRLFSRAALEHEADIKVISLMSALESWLLDPGMGTQTMRLARNVSWFGCGRHNNEMCGRSRPACPYLYLDPGVGKDRNLLNRLKDMQAQHGDDYIAWRCGEWTRILDWYGVRSGAVHGDFTVVPIDRRHVGNTIEYWIARILAVPILEWLSDHLDHPIPDLEAEINSMPAPSRDAVVAALHSHPVPRIPPFP